jgi:hypothetical protein
LIAVSPEGTGCGLAEQNHLPNKGCQESRDIHMDGTIVDCSKVTSCVVVNGPGFLPLRRQQIAAWIDPVETASAHPLNCVPGVLMVALAQRDDFLILRSLSRTPPLEADGVMAGCPAPPSWPHFSARIQQMAATSAKCALVALVAEGGDAKYWRVRRSPSIIKAPGTKYRPRCYFGRRCQRKVRLGMSRHGHLVLDCARLLNMKAGELIRLDKFMNCAVEHGAQMHEMEDALIHASANGWVLAIGHHLHLTESGYRLLYPANDNLHGSV